MKTSFQATIDNSGYTLVADFTKNPYSKDNIQVLNPDADEVLFAWSDSPSSPMGIMPATFTSLTMGWKALNTRKLYAKKSSAGSSEITVNIW